MSQVPTDNLCTDPNVLIPSLILSVSDFLKTGKDPRGHIRSPSPARNVIAQELVNMLNLMISSIQDEILVRRRTIDEAQYLPQLNLSLRQLLRHERRL